MKQNIVCILFLIFISTLAQSQGEGSLIILSNNWEFSEAGKTGWLPARVPGCIHTDLLANGKIEDPFYQKNLYDVQWIEKKDWVYRTVFSVNEKMLGNKNIDLVFEGLDTYFDVYLNNELIFSGENMFVGWRVPVKGILAKNNELSIHFYSAVNKGDEKKAKLDYLLLAANEHAPVSKKNYFFSRKAPFHFGWDWGPRLVTCGIFRPVKIEGYGDFRIKDVTFITKEATSDFAKIKLIHEVVSDQYANAFLIVKDGSTVIHSSNINQIVPGQNLVPTEFTIDNPRLWWPNGLGKPDMYEFSIELVVENKVIDEKSIKAGIRTIELKQAEDSIGRQFQFEVNGTPVFMKGANYIPSDIFTSRQTEEIYHRVLNNAVNANMNMLRVWGGGIYENDEFYNLCDEKGLLVWQDFMFACALVPGDSMHLENIRLEAEYNVKRLKNHPSMALWCGNNENLSAWYIWKWKDAYKNRPDVEEFLWSTYQKVFYEILPNAVRTYHPGINYWASSPSAYGNKPANRLSGDEHDWTIWFEQEPFSNFGKDVPRFVSEYGVQSFPDMSTIKAFAGEAELSYRSEIMESRQKSDLRWIEKGMNGNELIKRYILKYYKEPQNFEDLVYLSQLMQALAFKTGIESHRRNMPHCMGSLYWQLNDCWPAISWATVDYYGKWKAAHYAVKKAYSNLLVVPFVENDVFNISVVSDSILDANATINVVLYSFDGTVVFTDTVTRNISPNTSKVYYQKSLSELGEINPKTMFVYTELVEDGKQRSSNAYYFESPKNLDLPESQIIFSIYKENGMTIIELNAQELAKDVFIETDYFVSDNYFDLYPSKTKKIFLNTDSSIEELYQTIKVSSLVDTHKL